MSVEEAIEIVERHNEWRRGADTEMESPQRLGEAIDIVLKELKRLLYT